MVIGVGNPLRGDDAAGLEVASRLQRVTAHQSPHGGFELMDLWLGADEVVIVDAVRAAAPPGTVLRFDPIAEPLPQTMFASTHDLGLAETIELARHLGRLPARMVVYGIAAESFATGTGISAEVAAAIDQVVTEIDHA